MSFTPVPDLPALPAAGATGDDFNTPAIAFLTALRDEFQPALNTLADEFLTYAGALYKGTSTTSVTVGTGSKSFTTQTGLGFIGGQSIIVSSRANAANKMEGTVTSYNSGTGALVINAATSGGSGTYTDWDIGLNLASGGFLALTGGTLSGNLTISSTQPRYMLVETDGGSGYQRNDLMRDGDALEFRTYSSGASFVSTDYSMTVGASGVSQHQWRINHVAKLTLNSSGLTVADGIIPRVGSSASLSSPWAWNSNNFDGQHITALANAVTISADAGSPPDFKTNVLRFKDNGSSRVITFTGGVSKGFRDMTGELTVSGSNFTFATTPNKLTYFVLSYNSADARWDITSVRTQP